jgi:hypothetical protein
MFTKIKLNLSHVQVVRVLNFNEYSSTYPKCLSLTINFIHKKCQKTISVLWHFPDSGVESPGYQTFLLLNLYHVEVLCYTS